MTCTYSSLSLLAFGLLCSAILVSSATPDPLEEVSGFDIPSCANVGRCFHSAHVKAQECAGLEAKSAIFRRCSKVGEVNAARLEVIRFRCLWHRAMTDCMMGETPEDFFIPPLPFNELSSKVNITDVYKHKKCWQEAYHMQVNVCGAAASKCSNFGLCSGSDSRSAAESRRSDLNLWFQVVSQVNRLKDIATATYAASMKKCLDEAEL